MNATFPRVLPIKCDLSCQPPFYSLMRILLVKTSSLGDVVHNLPVLSDVHRTFPDARIDWCVEEAFADIPRLHPALDAIIPVSLRRWRKALRHAATWREMAAFRQRLRLETYDAILDTQGLIKSALIARMARGMRLGYTAEVAREPLAARFYERCFLIPPNAHAVERNRWLAAAAFDYPVDLPLDYGISAPAGKFSWLNTTSYAVLLTATSRDDKLWAEAHWISVAQSLLQQGIMPVFPAGNLVERQRATRLAEASQAMTAPPLRLRELATLLAGARLVIGVDTGLVHLAAALERPTIALYITTNPALTGVYGPGFVRNLGAIGQPPTPEQVLTVARQGLG